MPDTNQTINLTIRTTAELDGAKDAESELERQLIRAKALGEVYTDMETRLINVRNAINDFEKLPSISAKVEAAAANATLQRNMSMLLRAAHAGPMGIMQFFADPDPHRVEYTANVLKAQSDLEKDPLGPGNPLRRPDVRPLEPHWTEPPVPLFHDFFPDGEPDYEPPVMLDLTKPIGAPYVPLSQHNYEIPDERPPLLDPDDSNQSTAQTQAAQFSSQSLRSALELNSQYTMSLFDQMLEWVNSENQKLSELNHRLSILHGQIKSLKNP